MSLAIPRRSPGRQSLQARHDYEAALDAWCDGIKQLDSGLDFRVSSRGWCYILEQHGLLKGDFGIAQRLINDCRKSGHLPLDICVSDEGRSAEGLKSIDEDSVEDYAGGILQYVRKAHQHFNPISFWETQPAYVEVLVEKIDLKSLFAPVCHPYHVPRANGSGWNDINARAEMMLRFKRWESRGKQCVLLYCGDHDPGGLQISGFLRSNLNDLAGTVGWRPDNLVIERFGLNFNFIEENGLSWIENLETSNGKYPLDDQRHPDHRKPYVQDYIAEFGARKCEANSLVVQPEAGRTLCLEALRRYIDDDAIAEWREQVQAAREDLRLEIRRQIDEGALS
jgi:hypothetical protein